VLLWVVGAENGAVGQQHDASGDLASGERAEALVKAIGEHGVRYGHSAGKYLDSPVRKDGRDARRVIATIASSPL